VVARDEYALDSLVIMASCSPEGSYAHNRRLSAARSEAIRKYIGDYVPAEWRDSCLKTSLMPENWEQLRRLVANDTLMGDAAVKRILAVTDGIKDPDVAERKLSRMAEYRYLRERIYPKLRSVSFDFHLHRVGMQKDTVHTTELDTVYMAGLDALKELDYKKAVALLRPYGDYNSALAFMSADYNHSALDVLNRLDDRDPKVCYLKAMVLSRLEMPDEAMKYFELSIAYDPYMEYRANLDPEMFSLVKKRQTLINYNAYE
jgi:tetratricopeptide (TPR) repeat protein